MIIDALVQRINDNNARDGRLRERLHKEALELGNERSVGYSGVLFYNPDDAVSKMRITAGELICEGWKDVFEESPAKEISGTEKASAEGSTVCEGF